MVRLLIAFCLLVPALSFAQPAGVIQDEKNFTLKQRYWAMKSKAETYQEYKVIKEYVLDGVWRTAMDSVKEQKLLVGQGHQAISKLETDLQEAKRTLAMERKAATQITYDSTHISVLGIHLKKSVFIIFITAILSLLIFVGSVMVTKIKLLQATTKEKIVIADMISREFEEFKRKAMDKQIKLARELQNERNKLADLKQSLTH
jgi:hypothetical protein